MRGSIYNSQHMDHAGFLAQTYAGRHGTARRSCSPPPQPHTQRKARPELPRPRTVVPSTPGSQGLGVGCRRRDPAIRGDLQSRLAQGLPREGPRAPLLPTPAEYRPVCGWGIVSRGTEPVSPAGGGGRPPVQARGSRGPGQVPPPQGTWGHGTCSALCYNTSVFLCGSKAARLAPLLLMGLPFMSAFSWLTLVPSPVPSGGGMGALAVPVKIHSQPLAPVSSAIRRAGRGEGSGWVLPTLGCPEGAPPFSSICLGPGNQRKWGQIQIPVP